MLETLNFNKIGSVWLVPFNFFLLLNFFNVLMFLTFCWTCAPYLVDTNSMRLFQLLNTFLIKLRSIFDHSSFFPFKSHYMFALFYLKFSASNNRNRKNQAGYRLMLTGKSLLLIYGKANTSYILAIQLVVNDAIWLDAWSQCRNSSPISFG